MLCDYGCGQEAKFQFKNGKWCCEDFYTKCPNRKQQQRNIIKNKRKDKNSIYNSNEYRQKLSLSLVKRWADPDGCYRQKDYTKKLSLSKIKQWQNNNFKKNMKFKIKELWATGHYGKEWSQKQSLSQKITIKEIEERYPFFIKIEEIKESRESGKFFVHCKNHNCKNSKEKGGWFLADYSQIYERIRQLEKGGDGCYIYCSQKCKDECILYNLHGDPYKDNSLPYTQAEYKIFRTFVLERDKYVCQFCGDPATFVHHERPQKLEPFFALDPDYAWACCEECHYKKAHQGECSTGNLAKIVCSVESQKFLNQNPEV